MAYEQVKVYFDGSHFIGIPHTESQKKTGGKSKVSKEKKEVFEKAYNDTVALDKTVRQQAIVDNIDKVFESKEQTIEFVDSEMKKKERNLIMRRMRFTRKVMLQEWSYFCTFTYSDELQSEDSFKKSLRNCLKHLSGRKGWKYAGVWERSPENNRLHFHALVYIPQGQMIGQIEERKDFDTRKNKMQVIHVNTHLEKRFGRNDFKAVIEQDKGQCLKYMMKYLQKSNERIVYSRNLPTYFVCNIDDQDVVCEVTSKYNYKIILFDDFTCWDKDWCYVGTVSKEVIELLPKAS